MNIDLNCLLLKIKKKQGYHFFLVLLVYVGVTRVCFDINLYFGPGVLCYK